MKDTFSKRYFHAFISEAKVNNELRKLFESTSNKRTYYVFRFSKSDIGAFILSFIDVNGDIHHKKILNIRGHYEVEDFEGEEFPNWKKVKQACKKEWHLTSHLPWGAAYESLVS